MARWVKQDDGAWVATVIYTYCPRCWRSFDITWEDGGEDIGTRAGRCPNCQTLFSIPQEQPHD